MSSSGQWSLFVGVIVVSLWTAMACGDDVSPQPTVAPDNDSFLDDEDYTSTPILPCATDMDHKTTCMLEGTVSSAVVVSASSQPLRVAFYSTAQLTTDGFPIDPANPAASVALPPPFDFPVPFRVPVADGTSYRGEAWLDANSSGVPDDGDLIGYSDTFFAGTVASIQLTLEKLGSAASP